jgi:hypothetical protein
MPPYFDAGHALEMVFGNRGSDHIRFEVLGLTFPDSNEDWYRSQLNVAIHIDTGTLRGFRSLVMFSDDFLRFRAGLERLSSEETTVASLETGDFLSVDVNAFGGSYEIWMQLDAMERDGEVVLRDNGAENWEWRLGMDRTPFLALVDSVRQVSDRYRIWSVSRG